MGNNPSTVDPAQPGGREDQGDGQRCPANE